MAEEEQGQSAVDKALAGIPGLRENVQGRQAPKAPENAEGTEEEPIFQANRPQIQDSEAVNEALNKIPGLRERMGGGG